MEFLPPLHPLSPTQSPGDQGESEDPRVKAAARRARDAWPLLTAVMVTLALNLVCCLTVPFAAPQLASPHLWQWASVSSLAGAGLMGLLVAVAATTRTGRAYGISAHIRGIVWAWFSIATAAGLATLLVLAATTPQGDPGAALVSSGLGVMMPLPSAMVASIMAPQIVEVVGGRTAAV